jgi:hypothetical protein
MRGYFTRIGADHRQFGAAHVELGSKYLGRMKRVQNVPRLLNSKPGVDMRRRDCLTVVLVSILMVGCH